MATLLPGQSPRLPHCQAQGWHVLFPTGANALTFHCPRGRTGPVVSGSLLPHPHGPSLPGQGAQVGTRCQYPVAAVPRGGPEEESALVRAARYADQTSYTSTAVLPAPMPGWWGHGEASRQMTGGDGTCGAATAAASWVLTTGPLDPHGLGPAIPAAG